MSLCEEKEEEKREEKEKEKEKEKEEEEQETEPFFCFGVRGTALPLSRFALSVPRSAAANCSSVGGWERAQGM